MRNKQGQVVQTSRVGHDQILKLSQIGVSTELHTNYMDTLRHLTRWYIHILMFVDGDTQRSYPELLCPSLYVNTHLTCGINLYSIPRWDRRWMLRLQDPSTNHSATSINLVHRA